jgi:Holliday junction resolvase RusA-like endonuclease
MGEHMVTLTLPPSLNQIYRKNHWGAIYKTKDGKRWMEYAACEIKSAFNKFEGQVVVKANIYIGDNRVRDLDNFSKLLFDSIKASGIIKDDRWQIVRRIELEGFKTNDKSFYVNLDIANY